MIRKTILVGLLSYSFSLTAAPIAMHQIKGLNKAAITHADLAPLLDTLATHPSIERKNLGKSIDAFYIGSGPIKVMMWSQMHGDENTASAALTDFLSYAIETKNDA
ncbi:hypothetical protein [Pseudoalteromonas sp. SG44-17]|uniref:hypothetical protein n=1 Tax=Pseudoalteromonas sp. SG44-17 TaxID=2760963 RepID=UPI0015FF0BFF|nr:hypothetical protein [Pseudoalteromonas sp. SG44-17]MBB1408292.1 hypothetical protein [Pseudoalteromonas sp. SG44-17]